MHGGGLVAVLDAAAVALGRPDGPRTLEGRLTSSVPIETPLHLEGRTEDGSIVITVLQGGQLLTSAAVTALVTAGAGGDRPWTGGTDGWPLPMSDGCLACGARNPLGLQVGLRFDGDGVWARLAPREPWRTAEDRLSPAMAPVLLDEVAWWLGALLMQEGGLTNRISLTLLRPDTAFGGPLVAAGRFADVTPVDRRRTFWRTRTALLKADGTPLASAAIVFRGGAEYSQRQMDYFRARTPADLFRRMFPRYAS